MIPRLEFGPIYKFVASAGIALIISAIALPWVLLRESSVLLITRAELDNLTEVAQETIDAKQHQSHALVSFYPWISLTLFIGGAICLIIGLRRWNGRQAVADEKEDRELQLLKRGLETEGPSERVERLMNEAAESVADRDPGEQEHAESPPGTAQPSSDPAGHRSRSATGNLNTRAFSAYAGVERVALRVLREAYSRTHRVTEGVKIAGFPGRAADMVALAPKGSAEGVDFVFELKYASSSVVPALARRAVEHAANFATALMATSTATTTAGVVIFVVDSEPMAPRVERLLEEAREADTSLFGPPVGCVVVSYAQLQSIASDEMRRRIEASIRESD